jgi:hypothetical protein
MMRVTNGVLLQVGTAATYCTSNNSGSPARRQAANVDKRTAPQMRTESQREATTPIDAATLLLVRDGPAGGREATGRRRSAAAANGSVVSRFERIQRAEQVAEAAYEAYLEEVWALAPATASPCLMFALRVLCSFLKLSELIFERQTEPAIVPCMQMQQYRLKLLNTHANEVQRRRRTQSQSLAAEWHAQAAAADARRRAQRLDDTQPYDLSYAAPIHEESDREAMRAQVVDTREDLDVQIARKKVC